MNNKDKIIKDYKEIKEKEDGIKSKKFLIVTNYILGILISIVCGMCAFSFLVITSDLEATTEVFKLLIFCSGFSCMFSIGIMFMVSDNLESNRELIKIESEELEEE